MNPSSPLILDSGAESGKPQYRSSASLDARSIALRHWLLQILASARRGHILATLSVMEIHRVLYDDVLMLDPSHPDWIDRDRFILSKGHGCLALYMMLAERGFFPREELHRFCREDGRLGGHPERGAVPGVEASTGSLGHGLSLGIGMALAIRYRRSRGRVFVLMGDGECNEGSVWEAALCASKHRLDHLTILVDRNRMQSAGSTREILDLEPFAQKWESFGLAVREVDGHDVSKLRDQLMAVPFVAGAPSVLLCDTIKGRGLSTLEENLDWHHKSNITDAEMKVLSRALEDECARHV